MTAEPDPRFMAFQRFGLGPRPGSWAAITDARDALHAEMAHVDAAMIDAEAFDGLEGTAGNTAQVFAAAEARRDMQAAAMSAEVAETAPQGRSEAAASAAQARIAALKQRGGAAERIYRAEALARFRKAAAAPIGFVERLVAFWSNHFCVSVAKGEIARATAGSFEREAIRPFVLGRFGDMLAAVERHPAMLLYLDNAQSVGPDSPAGGNGRRGLNENLAREMMELHTLGVDGGYGQADVTALARVLTGWTYAGREGQLGEPGTFVFNARAHEPGDAMVTGHAYLADGLAQGERALTDLARAPATATHVATKLARHMLADDPPPAAVDHLARAFTRTDGDLRAVALALVDLPLAWSAPLTKLRAPDDLAAATLRLLGGEAPADPGPLLEGMRQLGMPLWEPPSPSGFSDIEADWGSPEGMKLRLDAAAALAHHLAVGLDPLANLDLATAGAASAETRLAVERAASREQAVALILMAPEFQRR